MSSVASLAAHMTHTRGKSAMFERSSMLKSERICADQGEWLGTESSDTPPNPCFQRVGQLRSDPSTWRPDGFAANYCLSQKVQQRCGFNVNLITLIVVVICNVGKLVGMLYVSFGNFEKPLVTVGDAISSFLECPDPTTKGMCLWTKWNVVSAVGSLPTKRSDLTWDEHHDPQTWVLRERRWYSTASRGRWFFSHFL